MDVRSDSRMRVIALSGRRANVMTAEDAIKQLDVPSAGMKDIELTVYFVVGTDQSSPGPTQGSPIPQELQSTVATLKSTFPFKTYFLLDVLLLRSRSGVGAETSGQLSGQRITTFRVRSASLDGDGGMIRLDQLHAGVRVPVTTEPGKVNYIDTGMSADVVDAKLSQQIVVGRNSLNGSEALFLVLTAKVVN